MFRTTGGNNNKIASTRRGNDKGSSHLAWLLLHSGPGRWFALHGRSAAGVDGGGGAHGLGPMWSITPFSDKTVGRAFAYLIFPAVIMCGGAKVVWAEQEENEHFKRQLQWRRQKEV